MPPRLSGSGAARRLRRLAWPDLLAIEAAGRAVGAMGRFLRDAADRLVAEVE